MSAAGGSVPAGWGRVLAVWLVIGGCTWFLVSFARRDGGTADAEALYDAWFGARPAGLSIGDARTTSDGAVVLQMSFVRGVPGASLDPGQRRAPSELPSTATNVAGLPTQLTLVVYPDAQDVLAAFAGFSQFQQKLPEDLAAEAAKEEQAAGAGAGMQFGSLGASANPWREIERGDLSFGAWTSAYMRLRRVKKGEPDRDQVRLNLSDNRRFAVLLAAWEPGVASALEPLEAFLAEFEPRIEVSEEHLGAR